MSNEIFATVKLPTGGEAIVIEGSGMHLFLAMSKSGGDSGMLIKHLVIQLTMINGKPITEKQIDSMHIRDANYLTTVISTMMSDKYIDGI